MIFSAEIVDVGNIQPCVTYRKPYLYDGTAILADEGIISYDMRRFIP